MDRVLERGRVRWIILNDQDAVAARVTWFVFQKLQRRLYQAMLCPWTWSVADNPLTGSLPILRALFRCTSKLDLLPSGLLGSLVLRKYSPSATLDKAIHKHIAPVRTDM